MQALSNAIFERSADDEEAVRAFHAAGGARNSLSTEAMDQKDEAYWNRRCRRMVRQPAALKTALRAVMQEFSDCPDPDLGGVQLLTDRTWQVLRAAEELIDSGSFCGEHQA
jgi:hypothetical protein